MSQIIHRNLRQAPPLAVKGEGIVLHDSAGKTYLDGSSGAVVSSLGHGHPDVIAAMVRQLERCAYAHTAFFSTEVAEELADRLVRQAPGDMGGVYFVSGGSEAIETALKLARQYWVERGEPQRCQFMARRQSYHGNTLGALGVGGNLGRKEQFQAIMKESILVSPCYEYRGRAAHVSAQDFTAGLLDELETAIIKHGPETIIAFIAEPVVGATGGAVPATPGYFRGVREICDRHRILFIADEVMCGMGRTGTMHALEQDQVAADIVVVAKGLAAGYAPMGAVLAHQVIVECLRDGSGLFQHGHTYIGHPVAAAAALAVQQVIERDDLLARVKSRGATLRRMLGDVFGSHEHVGDIRGRGLMLALELVQERDSKTPFPASRKLHASIKAQAMQRGLLVYPMGGTIDGKQGDHVLVAPPFIATAADLSEIVSRLDDALEAALRE